MGMDANKTLFLLGVSRTRNAVAKRFRTDEFITACSRTLCATNPTRESTVRGTWLTNARVGRLEQLSNLPRPCAKRDIRLNFCVGQFCCGIQKKNTIDLVLFFSWGHEHGPTIWHVYLTT